MNNYMFFWWFFWIMAFLITNNLWYLGLAAIPIFYAFISKMGVV